MKIQFENSIRRLSFLCPLPDIKIACINPWHVLSQVSNRIDRWQWKKKENKQRTWSNKSVFYIIHECNNVILNNKQILKQCSVIVKQF